MYLLNISEVNIKQFLEKNYEIELNIESTKTLSINQNLNIKLNFIEYFIIIKQCLTF